MDGHEYIAAMRQQFESYQLKGRVKLKALYDWLGSLDEEGLDALDNMLTLIVGQGEMAAGTANFWHGVVTMLLQSQGVNPWGDDLVSEDGLTELLEGSEGPPEGPESDS